MNIMPIGIASNTQPVNRHHNNVRFTGNQQSRPDSFTPSRFANFKKAISKKVKSKLMNRLEDPKYMTKLMKRLEDPKRMAKLMKRLEDPKYMAKLMKRLEDPRWGDSIATILVEKIANNGMKSLNQVLQSTEGLTSKRADHLRIIANKALDLGKPQVTLEIAETLTETLKNSDNTQVHKDRMLALKSIGEKASRQNPGITARIAKALIENFQDPHKSHIRPQITDALNNVTIHLTYWENREADEVLEALAKAIKNSDNRYICKIEPGVLSEMANRALKSGNREAADVAVKTLTETLQNSEDTYFDKASILALRGIGLQASIQNPEITARIAKTLIENFQDPHKSNIRPEITDALNSVTLPLIYKENREADEVLEALAKVLKNPNNPYIPKIEPGVLVETVDRALKSGNPEVADVIVKALTKTFKKSDDTHVHRNCLRALNMIGNRALKIKKESSIVPNTLTTNSDKIARLVISQLFKIATNPKLDQEKALWQLKKSAEIFMEQDISKYIEDCQKAIKELGEYKREIRKFDKAFRDKRLSLPEEKLSEKDKVFIKNLYRDLALTEEKLKKVYEEKLKTEPEHISQRYGDYSNHLRNRQSSEILIAIASKYNEPCFHPLKKGNQTLTQDIVALIPEVDNPKEDGSSRARSILGNVSKCLIEKAKKIK